MRRLNLSEVRNEKQKILDHFVRFCDTNDIKYSIAYGTMLGAVRHGGWIPWDDDIDVILLREEWNKFFSLYNNEKEERFKVVNNAIDKSVHTKIGYMYDVHTHMKPRNSDTFEDFNAIQIDIYPLDCIPKNRIARCVFMGRTRMLGILAKMADLPAGNPGGNRSRAKIILANIVNVVMKPWDASWFIRRQTKVAQKYDLRFSEKEKLLNDVNMLCTNIKQMPLIPYTTMREFTDISFEGKVYKMVSDYDSFLRRRYGNYMELPPKSQRVCYTYNTEEYYIAEEYYESAESIHNDYIDEWK